MRKTIILLALLALLIFAAPFVLARLSEVSDEPIPEATPEPTAEPTPIPIIEVVEIVIPAPDESCTPKPIATPTADFWPVFPVIDEPVTESPTQRPPSGGQSSGTPTPIPQVSVPKDAAFVLSIKGKNITIAKKIDEQTLEQSPGWLDSSAKPGKEGVCVVYGHIVIIRQQETAEAGQVIVALVDESFATLKRYYPRLEDQIVELRPENDAFEPQIIDLRERAFAIQGIAVKVLKDI